MAAWRDLGHVPEGLTVRGFSNASRRSQPGRSTVDAEWSRMSIASRPERQGTREARCPYRGRRRPRLPLGHMRHGPHRRASGLGAVSATHVADLRDYWDPFLAGSGAASTYLATISTPQRRRYRAELERTLPMERDGSIRSLHERGPSSERWQRGNREHERGGPCGARTRDRAIMSRLL
jgi:hypothetical protein